MNGRPTKLAGRWTVCFGALLVLVLLAGLQMPQPTVPGVGIVPVVASVERSASPRHPAAVCPPAPVLGARVCASVRPVRAIERRRSVAERGLPCPRAPTA